VRRDLTPDDIADLLHAPKCSTLATYRRDGTVLLSPVWHEWREGTFWVHVGRNDVKGQHVRSDPRVSLVLYDDTPPYCGIEMRGRATLIIEGEREAVRRIAIRYLGEKVGNAYVDGFNWEGMLLRIDAERTRIWDFRDEYTGLGG